MRKNINRPPYDLMDSRIFQDLLKKKIISKTKATTTIENAPPLRHEQFTGACFYIIKKKLQIFAKGFPVLIFKWKSNNIH